jgi:cytochrome c2
MSALSAATIAVTPAKIAATIAVVAVVAGGGAALITSSAQRNAIARALTGGDPAVGPALIRRYGCGGCHTVSGVAGADGKVAAPLDHLRQRVFIGGVVRNTPDNLVHWIVSPRRFSPRTAMPETGISEAEARDIAAFLYSR